MTLGKSTTLLRYGRNQYDSLKILGNNLARRRSKKVNITLKKSEVEVNTLGRSTRENVCSRSNYDSQYEVRNEPVYSAVLPCFKFSLTPVISPVLRGSFYFIPTLRYLSRLILSSWDSRTRLVPTRILSSSLSLSLLSRSRECPWCCIRTHSLFISAKFISTKSTASFTCHSRSHLAEVKGLD